MKTSLVLQCKLSSLTLMLPALAFAQAAWDVPVDKNIASTLNGISADSDYAKYSKDSLVQRYIKADTKMVNFTSTTGPYGDADTIKMSPETTLSNDDAVKIGKAFRDYKAGKPTLGQKQIVEGISRQILDNPTGPEDTPADRKERLAGFFRKVTAVQEMNYIHQSLAQDIALSVNTPERQAVFAEYVLGEKKTFANNEEFEKHLKKYMDGADSEKLKATLRNANKFSIVDDAIKGVKSNPSFSYENRFRFNWQAIKTYPDSQKAPVMAHGKLAKQLNSSIKDRMAIVSKQHGSKGLLLGLAGVFTGFAASADTPDEVAQESKPAKLNQQSWSKRPSTTGAVRGAQ